MSGGPPVTAALVILASAVLVVPFFKRARMSPVVGYVAAGAFVGPHGFGWVSGPEAVQTLAHLGIVFLLFSLGLELSIQRLVEMRRLVLGLGTVQMIATTLAVAGGLHIIGVRGNAAMVLACGAAFSSTAIVMRLLEERHELATTVGRSALAVLLLQDLAVIPLLAVVPLLGIGAGISAAVAAALLKATVAVGVILVAGRFLLSPLLHSVARAHAPELFTAVVLLLALGVGYLTELAGLSMALGAFLAGLLIAETQFRHQVAGDIQPFGGLLLALFFMSVGMGVDLGSLIGRAPLILILSLGLVFLKTLVLTAAARAYGLVRGDAFRLGISLAQGGEFALVLFTLSVGANLLDPGIEAIAVMVVTLTMALTPMMVSLGERAARKVAVHASWDRPPVDLADHVLIAGFGRAGRTVARLLDEEGVAYVALDMDSQVVSDARRQGLPVYYGDSSRVEVLTAAGAAQAVAAAVTLDDPRAAERAVSAVRRSAGDIPVVVRARYTRDLPALGAAGATVVVPELIEGSLQLAASVLEAIGHSRDRVDRVLDAYREAEYERLGELASGSMPRAAPGPGRTRVLPDLSAKDS
jgi:monovalent cation:H+ antiporter-2, CPA2 family